MKICFAMLAVCLAFVCAGCGSDDPDEFLACLTERGGTDVSGQSQLARLVWRDAEDGGGAWTEHLKYSLIGVPSADGDGTRALVVLDPGYLNADALARAVRAEPQRFRDVVLLSPRSDWPRPVSDCFAKAVPDGVP